jgi:Cu(I)/Ag(I) efflux system membrane fusion protein
MKNKKIVLASIVAGLLAAGAYGMYRLGIAHGSGTAASPGAAVGGLVDPATGRKVLYWHDPMVPGQKFDKPGKSPFMDMQLVPVYADAAGDDGKVTISPRVQQNLGVRTAEVTRSRLAPLVEAVGNIAWDEREVALVPARSNGFLERLLVRAPLDPVKKGQALAELYVPDWVAAQEEFLAVKRMQGSAAEGLLDAARQRMRLAGMTEDQVRSVEARGKVQPRLTIRAPIGGVVAELPVREGMAVTAGTPLFRINGLDTIWVNAEVPEAVAARIRSGTRVEVRTPSSPGTVLEGRVGAVLPGVDAATRTVRARVELANPGHRLVPGMFATVNFTPEASGEVLTVPTEAVIQTGKRSVVMLAEGDGKFMPVDVQIGNESQGQTEIRKGLEAGQKVVVSGQFLIDSEASLRGSAGRMSGTPAPESRKAAAPTHRGEGKVEQIGKDDITLSHGPIPSMQWPAMTMGFKVPPGRLPNNLAAGDSVRFEFVQTKDGAFEITRIVPSAPSPAGKEGVKR